ncbi:MAG: HAD family phosphatase [Litoreibacter sp.]
MNKLQSVIFDCDGVIVDSERLTNEVLRDDLESHGLKLTVEEVMDAFVGGTMVDVHKRALIAGADLPSDWVEAIYEKIYICLAERVELIPGILDVLDALEVAGIPYAVGSNGRVRKMEITLGRCGILDRFEGRLLSGQDFAAPKPAPDVYLGAMQLLGAAPSSSAVIEDSATGARAGRASGARTYGFFAETPKERLDPHCDVLFDDMGDLPRLLGL